MRTIFRVGSNPLHHFNNKIDAPILRVGEMVVDYIDDRCPMYVVEKTELCLQRMHSEYKDAEFVQVVYLVESE